MIDRKELLEEQLLREGVRKAIKKVRSEKAAKQKLEEKYLRKVVRGLLVEKIAVADESPHEKTGINILRKTLKKVIPQMKEDYLSLTTDVAQRESYIAHLVNGIDNLLAPVETNIDAPDAPKGPELEEEIEINVGDEEDDKFIDIGDMGLGDDEEEEEEEIEIDDDEEALTRGLEDKEHDETGRNVALGTFKQIQGTIVDDFGELANDEDRELYHDYLKTNMLLWRDRFESVLSTKLPTPTTPEYEKEKQQVSGEEEELFEILDI